MIGIGEIAQIASASAMDQGQAMANYAGLGSTEAQAMAIDTVMNASAYKNSVGQSFGPSYQLYNSAGTFEAGVVNATLSRMQNGWANRGMQESVDTSNEILNAVFG